MFTDQDLIGVHLPYENALVITMRVANVDIRQVLVNNESSVSVMFFSMLRKMEFELRKVEPA